MNDGERQILVTAPRRAELADVERPAEALPYDAVEGRTLATVVSVGTELAWAYTAESGHPLGPGYAAVFEVEQVGAEVTDLRPGDRAFCMGPHRSFQRVARSEAVRVPATLEPRDAVLARLMGVSMTTLTTTNARPPGPVLVTGLGLVGHLAAKLFAACGYRVIGVDPDEARRDLMANAVERVEAATPLDDASVAGRVALCVECSGHEQAVLDACRASRKGGEVVLVGVPWARRTDLAAFDLLHAVFHKYVVLRSGWEWELPRQPTEFARGNLFGNFATAIDWLARGRVNVEGLCEVRRPSECGEVYAALAEGKLQKLSAVFDWTQ